MIPLHSGLENREAAFKNMNDYLGQYEFTLGGNWEYDHGYFDRYLDEEHKVWIRIPFVVTSGSFDGVEDASDAVVKLGQPFVLRHEYNEGMAQGTGGSMINQFQSPVDPDAEVDGNWVKQAKELLGKVEQGLVH